MTVRFRGTAVVRGAGRLSPSFVARPSRVLPPGLAMRHGRTPEGALARAICTVLLDAAGAQLELPVVSARLRSAPASSPSAAAALYSLESTELLKRIGSPTCPAQSVGSNRCLGGPRGGAQARHQGQAAARAAQAVGAGL